MPDTHPPRDPHPAGTTNPTLPTPRALLTTLLSSPPPAPPPASASTTTNPLHHAPPSVRAHLTTLHILLPTLLLPALDLLDRNLLTHVSQSAPVAPSPAAPAIHPANDQYPAPGPRSGAPATDRDAPSSTTQNHVYLVRSAQASRARAHAERHYTVRLGAWNCNCAAFAFAAFPAGLGAALGVDYAEPDVRWDSDRTEEGEGGWEFGGVSRDGVGGGEVPCCKHLLACVLAERWEGWLGGYVEERKVGREEMAGLTCDG